MTELPSTGAYLRLLTRDTLVRVGVGLVLLGMLLVSLSNPETGRTLALVGGASLLGGAVVLGMGYTRVQHRLRDAGVEHDVTPR